MRVIVWSDLHADAHRFGSNTTDKGYNTRLLDCVKAIDATSEAVRRHGAPFRLFAGDLLHQRGRLGKPSTFNPVFQAIAASHQVGNPFVDVLIPGNHDDESRADGEYAIKAFGAIDGVYVYDGWGIQDFIAPGPHALYVAWVCHHPDVDVVKARLRDVAERLTNIRKAAAGTPDLDYKSILMLHHGVDGTLPDVPRCGLTSADLPTSVFDWTFVGDYHMFKELVPGKAWSVGTPLQHNFGDAGKRCGYLVLDTDTGELIQEQIEDLPRFCTLEVRDGMVVNSVDECRPGDFVCVSCDDEALLDQIRDNLLNPVAQGGKGAAAVMKDLIAKGQIAGKIENAIRLAMDPIAMLKAWVGVATKDGQIDAADAAALLEIGIEVYEEVKS